MWVLQFIQKPLELAHTCLSLTFPSPEILKHSKSEKFASNPYPPPFRAHFITVTKVFYFGTETDCLFNQCHSSFYGGFESISLH